MIFRGMWETRQFVVHNPKEAYGGYAVLWLSFYHVKKKFALKKNEGAFIGGKNRKTKKIKYELLDPSIYVVIPWLEE